jgi:hypothetical protein
MCARRGNENASPSRLQETELRAAARLSFHWVVSSLEDKSRDAFAFCIRDVLTASVSVIGAVIALPAAPLVSGMMAGAGALCAFSGYMNFDRSTRVRAAVTDIERRVQQALPQ